MLRFSVMYITTSLKRHPEWMRCEVCHIKGILFIDDLYVTGLD